MVLDFNAMQLLEEESSSDDDHIRVDAYRNISTIAEALGCEQTENQLLNFLNNKTKEDDEILLVIAKQLGDFHNKVNNINLLFPILENLAAAEETVVREEAMKSLNKLIAYSKIADETTLNIMKRLTNGDWFSSKISASGIFATLYPIFDGNENKETLRTLYNILATDDMPLVKKAAASHMGEIAAVMEPDQLTNYLLPIFKKLVTDEQETVKCIAVKEVAKFVEVLAKHHLKDEICNSMLPIVRAAVEDRSWRVRHAIGYKFCDTAKYLATGIDQDTLIHDLLGLYMTILRDQEGEVRVQACKSFAPFCHVIGTQAFIQYLMPAATDMINDLASGVRVNLSEACMELAPLFGEKDTVKYIIPLLIKFLNEATPGEEKVRLNILNKMSIIASWIPQVHDEFIPILILLREDEVWRVRKAVIEALPLLAEHLGIKFFEEKLLNLYFSGFKDRIFEVRAAAAVGIPKLYEVAGGDWIATQFLPTIKKLYDDANFYLIRLAILHALSALAIEGMSKEILNSVTAILIKGANDNIPNVRFTAAQTLASIVNLVDDTTVTQQIRPTLMEMSNGDPDEDVRFYAGITLETCG